MLEARSYNVVYPPQAEHTNLAREHAVSVTALVDTLSIANHQRDIKLVQALSKLEHCQLAIATVKMLDEEEWRVTDVEETALIKTTVSESKLGPALMDLDGCIKQFAAYVSKLNADDLQAWSDEYNFTGMIQTLDEIMETELNKALDRWKCILNTLCEHYSTVLPDKWKEKAVESFDQEFVQNKIIVQNLIDGLGSEYCAVNAWLLSLAKFPDLEQKFKDRWEKEFAFITATVKDVLVMVAVMLAYNCLLHKYPKLDASERRQAYKDFSLNNLNCSRNNGYRCCSGSGR